MGWRIALYAFLALLGVICVLFLLPVGIRVRYNDRILRIWYTIGPLRLRYHPEKKENKKSGISVRTVLNEPVKANRKYDGALGDFWAELKTTLELFWALRPKLRVKRLMLKLFLAGDDPCAIALQYGGAWAAVGSLVPLLEEAFVINKRDVTVEADFSGEETHMEAKLDIVIGLGRLLLCLVRYSVDTINRADAAHKHNERRS